MDGTRQARDDRVGGWLTSTDSSTSSLSREAATASPPEGGSGALSSREASKATQSKSSLQGGRRKVAECLLSGRSSASPERGG